MPSYPSMGRSRSEVNNPSLPEVYQESEVDEDAWDNFLSLLYDEDFDFANKILNGDCE